MTASLNQNTILRLFWHRTRREFVPLTTVEIKRHTGMSDKIVRGSLTCLVRDGYLYSYSEVTYSNIYEPTQEGQQRVSAVMMGEAS